MHQLKALLWRSYKVRSRQYYTTGLDLFGPIIVIALYVATKILLNQTHEPQVDVSAASIEYFPRATRSNDNGSNTNSSGNARDHIDLKRDIRRYMCTKILYFPGNFDEQQLPSTIASQLRNECGFQLTKVSSRRELLGGLQRSLASRVAYQRAGTDLNKINSTSDNCIKLPPVSGGNDDDETIYQIGLARTGRNMVEIHMTDSAGSSVIFMPYAQGSTYNEYTLPQSDLNLGAHLLEICLANVFSRARSPLPPDPSPAPSTTRATGTVAPSTTTSPSTTAATTATSVRPTRSYRRADRPTSPPSQRLDMMVATLTADVKWRYKPLPVQTGVFVLPISTSIAILLAYLCTNTATVMRLSEEIEFGLHRYVRLAGLPAVYYWLSVLIMTTLQAFVQGLVIAILLGIPTGDYLYDPVCECFMTTRWMLLFTYSLMANTHAILLASLMDRSSTSLMVCSLMASTYAEYTLLLIIQWTPYRFNPMSAINWYYLLNPASNFLALCCVLIAVALQTGEPFGWSHLSGRIIGGGFSELSVAELWALMFAQIFVCMLLTILIDQFKYSTTTNFFGFLCALANELCFCNHCGPQGDKLTEELRTKSSLHSQRDPNRICCSLRHVEVRGSTVMVPLTKGNPLRMSREQMRVLRAQVEERTISKTTQLLVNTRPGGSPSSARDTKANKQSTASLKEQPLLLDDVIKQNLVWYKTDIKYKDLNLDFRFNQISFVLGQTDLKELLFAALLGVNPLDAGHIILDGTHYSAATLSLARQHMGYLSDKDIFYNELTIFENLQFYGSIRERAYKSYDSESLYVLSLLHLSSRRDNFPASLTHRSARKLALGVASVGYTKLLLLTEPTLNLRWRPRCQVLNLLRKYKSIRSIVVDSSDVDEAVAFGDRVVLLKNGTADLSDSPERLAKRLACGYWLVFEPTTGDGRTVNSEAIRALERLTNEIFKQDKLDLDASKVSIYQDLQTGAQSSAAHSGGAGGMSGGVTSASSATTTAAAAARAKKTVNSGGGALAASAAVGSRPGQTGARPTHRLMVIVKVHHSQQSARALCNLLKMFANRNIHGFRLAQVSYESLEDILVLRMSRALYPDLPPDLLLSLQHRTQMSSKSPEQSPISVRKLSSSSQQQQLAAQTAPSSTIFAAGLTTIIRDRLRNRSELLLTLMALIVSLIVILLTLSSLKSSLRAGGQSAEAIANNSARQTTTTTTLPAPPQALPFMTQAARDRRIVELSSVEQLYKNRIGFYLLARGSAPARHRHKAATSTHLLIINNDENNNSNNNTTRDAPNRKDDDDDVYNKNKNGSIKNKNNVNTGNTGSDDNNNNKTSAGADNDVAAGLLRAWHGNRDLAGVIYLGDLRNQTDAQAVARLVDLSRDAMGSLITLDLETGEASVIFEPHLPHVFLATIKTFLDFSYSLTPDGKALLQRQRQQTQPWRQNESDPLESTDPIWEAAEVPAGNISGLLSLEDYASSVYTSRVNFQHTWHEMIQGYPTRRLIYGFGFAVAEAIFMGALVMVPMRHRSESKLTRVQTCYWLSMGAFDMLLSLLHILCYLMLFSLIEGLHDGRLMSSMLIVLLLYKLASLPIPYLTSLAAESTPRACLFILLLYYTVAWDMAIFLRAFVEWTIYSDNYLYTISNWILFGMPITGLIESLTVINQVHTINARCPEVPAYTATSNSVPLEGIHRTTVVDTLLEKVRECLASGKVAISTDVMHRQGLGILWSVYLIMLFGLIIWAFLLTSERLFGIVARRLSSNRTSNDPMKTVIRLPDHLTSLFVWDKERDRLVSEYIRCLNEIKYVRMMAHNCLILRIWLKPMSDQSSPDHHVATILEPLASLGQSKNDIQVELRTTLQIFVRIGDETKHCRVDKIQLIETYSKFLAAHGDIVAKFAVVDWTRENLYKILLHGHYNNKAPTTTSVT